MYSFSNFEPICCSMSSSNCCFLICIQIAQETGKVIWYYHLFQSFPQFVVIHTVKSFTVVNEAEFVNICQKYLFLKSCGNSSSCWVPQCPRPYCPISSLDTRSTLYTHHKEEWRIDTEYTILYWLEINPLWDIFPNEKVVKKDLRVDEIINPLQSIAKSK